MKKSNKSHVITYGDAFVDFIAKDITNKSYNTYLGGASLNVAVGLSRLKVPSYLMTVTGEDENGQFVRNELLKENVRLDYAQVIPEKQVTGVYVHLMSDNERIFHKYMDETPHVQLEKNYLATEAFLQASIFHISSGTMFHSIALTTTQQAVAMAKKAGTLISFDVNIRLLRWESEAQCRNTIHSFLTEVDILKLTVEELLFLTETSQMEDGIDKLVRLNIPLILVTVGESGTYAIQNQKTYHIPVKKVEPVDTTGAGDAFMAGLLRYVYFNGIPSTSEALFQCIAFANNLGALATTKHGAMTAMPRLEEIDWGM
ncbi:carbohydrate kinase [Bacillus haimaensis]|uniref:carbohydrate kinase family protein n=1 Tax=Bacillus haimaensis TaxID=3160967 RepID=UPI003AA7F8C6